MSYALQVLTQELDGATEKLTEQRCQNMQLKAAHNKAVKALRKERTHTQQLKARSSLGPQFAFCSQLSAHNCLLPTASIRTLLLWLRGRLHQLVLLLCDLGQCTDCKETAQRRPRRPR